MALAYAMLTLLVDCPHSGYDLNKKFASTVCYFWQASYQQIYRELNKMEKLGWVTSEVVPQESRPNKKLYRATELGKQQLVEWILQPNNPMVVREEMVVKTSVSYLVPSAVMVAEIKRHRQLHVEKLATYRELEQEIYQEAGRRLATKTPHDLPPDWRPRYLALRRGIRYETDCIEWCDEASQMLEASNW